MSRHSNSLISAICQTGARPLLQEVVAAGSQPEAAVGFSLALAAYKRKARAGQIVWVRQDAAARETGDPYGPGLAALGIDPSDLLLVHARTFSDALRASLEVVRCPVVSVALIETVAPTDLTATRRLKLAAEKSGVAPILIRHADVAMSNAASIRWRVKAARCREADAALTWPPVPRAVFEVALLKHPAGLDGSQQILEWHHEQRQFRPALSLPVAAVPLRRSLAA